MSDRFQWVFYDPCGCPFGVLEGSCASSRSKAWKSFYETARERDAAVDRGVSVRDMPHAEYAATVMPLMTKACPHEVEKHRG